jgi:hypothetical protein
MDPHELDKTKVLMTMVGGKVVYESDDWKSTKAAKSGE